MPKASVKRFIQCKKEQLIDLVLDIEKYPQFVPFCLGSKVYERNEKGNLLLIVADLTIGQYLQPSTKHHPLDRYYKPAEFTELQSIAESKGFLLVSSSPLTRSSYHADEDFAILQKNRKKQTNAKSIS